MQWRKDTFKIDFSLLTFSFFLSNAISSSLRNSNSYQRPIPCVAAAGHFIVLLVHKPIWFQIIDAVRFYDSKTSQDLESRTKVLISSFFQMQFPRHSETLTLIEGRFPVLPPPATSLSCWSTSQYDSKLQNENPSTMWFKSLLKARSCKIQVL